MEIRSAPGYTKEKDTFLRDLHHFHEIRGTPFKHVPSISGREVDLYHLYSLVTSEGGWIKVNSKNTWSSILSELGLAKNCVNGSVALKQIYLRYLDRWEKVHFPGEDGDRASDDDEESRHKRWSARALHSLPHTYNYSQHVIPEAHREYNYLSTSLYRTSDYDKLALSLISPLPNEQDFAINVCTLLSNDGKHTLKLEKHPRIVDFLLGHAGVFCHKSLRRLFEHNYAVIRKHPIHRFWREVISSVEYLVLDDEENFSSSTRTDYLHLSSSSSSFFLEQCMQGYPYDRESDSNNRLSPERIPTSPPQCDANRTEDDTSDQLFCLNRLMGTQNYVGQRVLQIATILRNLTFIEDNVGVLVRNRTFERFMLLCVCSQWAHLRNLGMDMIGNLAADMLVADVHYDRLSSVLLTVVTSCLKSVDRAECLLALDVLNKLCQNEANEDILLRHLEPDVYSSVCTFLTIHDVMLLICTLECLYSLSSLGERSCNLIVINHGVVDTLVSLVTVEGKSYGPKACIGMKLVETLTGGQPNTTPTSSGSSTSTCSPSTSTVSVSAVATAAVPTATTTTTSTATSTTTLTTTTVVSMATTTSACCMISPIAASTSTTNFPMTHSASAPISTTVLNSSSVTPSINLPPSRTTFSVSTTSIPIGVTPTRPHTTITQHRLLTTPAGVPSISVTPLPVNKAPSITTGAPTITPTSTITYQQQSSNSSTQMQYTHQQIIHENEQFALAWIRATYEPSAGGFVEQQEMYKYYLNACSKIGRKGVISPIHFPRCVRSVFGTIVGPNPLSAATAAANALPSMTRDGMVKGSEPGATTAISHSAAGGELLYYEGIKVRNHPLIINLHSNTPAAPSPIPPSQTSCSRKTSATPKIHTQNKVHKVLKSYKKDGIITTTITTTHPPVKSRSTAVTTTNNNNNTNQQQRLTCDNNNKLICNNDVRNCEINPAAPSTVVTITSTKASPATTIATSLALMPPRQCFVASSTPLTTTATATIVVPTSSSTANIVLPLKPPISDASILKAQLSTPNSPKKQDNVTYKMDVNSHQAMAHPHLSQALLGSVSASSSTVPTLSTNSITTTDGCIIIGPSALTSKEGVAATVPQQFTVVSTPSPAPSTPPLSQQQQPQPQVQVPSQLQVVGGTQSNTSLIKSLLATKVNDCMPTAMSMRTATDFQNVAQVAARQQRLLTQIQLADASKSSSVFAKIPNADTQPINRPNGARQLTFSYTNAMNTKFESVSESSDIKMTSENYTSDPTNISSSSKKEPPQPPPPPLAPLSCQPSTPKSQKSIITTTKQLTFVDSQFLSLDEDQNASSDAISEIGEDVNGGLTLDMSSNDDSNSIQDSLLSNNNNSPTTNMDICRNKPLRLADLLEKKVLDKNPVTILNGMISKDLLLRLPPKSTAFTVATDAISSTTASMQATADSTADAIQNHIVDKAIISMRPNNSLDVGSTTTNTSVLLQSNKLKRPASRDSDTSSVDEDEPAARKLKSNGSTLCDKPSTSPACSTPPAEDDENTNIPSVVSTAAAKLFADMAADILEDEDEEQQLAMNSITSSAGAITNEMPPSAPLPSQPTISISNTLLRPQQLMVATQSVPPKSVIVSNQPNVIPVSSTTTAINVVSSSTSSITHTPNRIINGNGPISVNSNTGQPFLLSSGQVQLVAGSQPGQYVLQASGNQQHGSAYVVAGQSQAGQPQTVLLAQTAQQSVTGAKTIIILQQPASNHHPHQKLMVTQQGQPLMVTQRPLIHHGPVTNVNNLLAAAVAANGNNNNNNNATTVVPSSSANTVIKSTGSVNVSNLIQQSLATSPMKVGACSSNISSSNSGSIGNSCFSSGGTVITASPQRIIPEVNASTMNETPQLALTDNTLAVAAGACNTTAISTKNLPVEENIRFIRDLTTPFVCEWGDCAVTTKFKSANQVYLHACEVHCPNGTEEIQCQWDRCDSMKRRRFSLMTHLHDKHCNTEAMKQSLVRRKQVSQGIKLEPLALPVHNTHPGYAPDAALHAIKRHALEFLNPKELQDDNEGPVTKSIRLTASLVLRNLVIYSANCKRHLKSYESHLANVALSNVESSRTIAQVLYDMNEGSSHR